MKNHSEIQLNKAWKTPNALIIVFFASLVKRFYAKRQAVANAQPAANRSSLSGHTGACSDDLDQLEPVGYGGYDVRVNNDSYRRE